MSKMTIISKGKSKDIFTLEYEIIEIIKRSQKNMRIVSNEIAILIKEKFIKEEKE